MDIFMLKMEQQRPADASAAANCYRGKQCAPQPSTSKQKYVSMFRIAGHSILPPLMTPEKRRQMQKLRERAIRLERILEDKRRKKLRAQLQEVLEGTQAHDDDGETQQQLPAESARSLRLSSCSGSISQRSNASADEHNSSFRKLNDDDNDDDQDPYELLSSLMRSREGRIADANHSSAIDLETLPTERNLMERMQKLQKSETLIYDNRANTIIIPMSGAQIAEEVLNRRQRQQELRDIDERANLNNYHLHTKVPAGKLIPSICVDPPTPLVGTRTLCEALSANASFESIDIAANLDSSLHRNTSQQSTQPSKLLEQLEQSVSECGLSSDESFNRSQTSLQDDAHALHAHTKVTNITAKIIQFEQLQETHSNNNNMRPPQRSATSPSLKQLAERSPRSCLDVTTRSGGSCDSPSIATEIPLVRSNSFTLDCPSKALLEHIRQQKQTAPRKTANASFSPSAQATRDTVESKAKRVQKVQLKSRHASPQPQMRRSCSRIGGNGGATTAPHSFSAAATSPYAAAGSSSNTQLFRAKRSPYELKSTATKAKLTRQLKKSSSNTLGATAAAAAALKNVKSKVSMPNIADVVVSNEIRQRGSFSPAAPASATSVDLLGEIQAEHRHKFHALIAQQQLEQRRMQHSFEAQQQLLLEQLNVEMSRAHLGAQSPRRKTMPSPTTDSRSRRRHASNSFSLHIEGHSPPMGLADSSPPPPHDEMLRSPTLSGSSSIVSSTSYTVACDLLPSLLLDTSAASSSTLTTTTSTALHTTGGGGGAAAAPTGAGIGRFTPRRRLFTRELTPSALSAVSSGGGGSGGSSASPTANRRQQHQFENERRVAAATCINACARGFLVRRLFETEQIQRIVQTIRDTLIFVLNLHLETSENSEEANTPANIKLKARLLQQLSSASRTLHLVCFQTTIKERMEIIARDRKRMKTKLLTMNIKRSPRIIG